MIDSRNTRVPRRCGGRPAAPRGFTLIEIMVVVVILGILAALVAPNVIRRIDDARVTKARQDIRAYETALNLYRMDNFRYPTTEQGLEALVKQPTDPNIRNWKQGGYIDGLKKDPWVTTTSTSPPARAARSTCTRSVPTASRAAKDPMPTSATGTSSSGRPRGRAARGAAGFTLLELLVVVVIIGIIASMAAVSTRVLGGDHEMDQEAKRLVAVLTQAREEAMLQGRDLGVRIDARGYDFLIYDLRNERWQLVADDRCCVSATCPTASRRPCGSSRAQCSSPHARCLPNARRPHHRCSCSPRATSCPSSCASSVPAPTNSVP